MSEEFGGIGKSMPWDEDAEKGVLSCFFHDPVNLLPVGASTMTEETFYHASNQILYRAMQEFSTTGRPLDAVTLTGYLRDKELLERVGGAAMISEIAYFVPTPAHFLEYRETLLNKAILREVIAGGRQSMQEAFECADAKDAGLVVSQAEARAFEVLAKLQTRGEFATGPVEASKAGADWMEHLQKVIDNRGKVLGLTTGLHDLDRTVHGIDDAEGEIVTIAARPGMGKTALAVTIAHHLGLEVEWEDGEGQARTGIPGAIFSVEMSKNQWLNRQVLGMAGIDTSKAHTGHFSREDFKRMHAGLRAFMKSPIRINDSASLTTADLRAQVQVMKRKYGIRWIMVDHLHLVKPVKEQGLKDERVGLVEVMQTLQFLKKQFKLGVFLMVQLNRETDRNQGKAPVLADLSGSAAIEQYSDHVIFIHRPATSKPWHRLSEEEQNKWRTGHDEQRRRNPQCWSDGGRYPEEYGGANDWPRQDYEEEAMLYVRKNRRGPTPDLPVRFQGEFTKFSSRTPALFSNHDADRQIDPGKKRMVPVVATKPQEPKVSGEMEDIFGDGAGTAPVGDG